MIEDDETYPPFLRVFDPDMWAEKGDLRGCARRRWHRARATWRHASPAEVTRVLQAMRDRQPMRVDRAEDGPAAGPAITFRLPC